MQVAEPWLVHCKLFKKITLLAAWLFACANFKTRIASKYPAWPVRYVPKNFKWLEQPLD